MAELHVVCGMVTVLVVFGTYMPQGKAECNVNIRDDLGTMSPLIMRTENGAVYGGTGFLQPSRSASMARLNENEEVELLCAGSNNRLKISDRVEQFKAAKVTCNTGGSFLHSGQNVSISDFRCTLVPQSTLRERGNCSSGHKRLQMGYKMSTGAFLQIIDICFDDMSYSTHYVNYTLAKGIQRRQVFDHDSNVDRIDYFGSLSGTPEEYYKCANQQSAVGQIIGSSHVNQYINCPRNVIHSYSQNVNYVVKAHLAAVFDFVYYAQQESAKYHVNVVPMWDSIKNGNWLNLAEEIRVYASNTSREDSDLVIYSGTLGVTNLTNHGIYLGTKNGRKVVPVPKWVWKLVYEPRTKEGIVFLVVNNPYSLHFACSCVCAQTKWSLAWNRTDTSKGYVYCCTVKNFRSVFSGLPDFEVTGLLTKDRPNRPPFSDVPAQ